MFFPDIVERLDAGELTDDDIEGLLTDLYGGDETDEKVVHRAKLRDEEGNLNKFQLVGLNRKVMVKHHTEVVEAQQAKPNVPDVKDVPDEIAEDAPQVYEGPDYLPMIKERFGIIEIVRRFGKPQQRINDSKEEGIMVRCPFDHHEDKDPSVSVNRVKDVWDCHKCNEGGDQIDFFVARKYGRMIDHRSSEYREPVVAMAKELGLWAEDPLPPPGPAPKAQTPPREDARIFPESEPIVPASKEAKERITISEDEMMAGIRKDDDLIIQSGSAITLDWRALQLPEESFLHLWMEQAEKEFYWIPSEYFLFAGLQAIGLACGHDVSSFSYKQPLNGSTMMVLVGPSGYGKSTVIGRLKRMFRTLPGPKFDKDIGTGIKMMPQPGSAEALIQFFATYIEDPGPPATKRQVGVRGWLPVEEFADFITKTLRTGGENLKQRIMELNDWVKWLDGPEEVFSEATISRGLVKLEDAFFSAIFSVQTNVLRALTEDKDLESGFMARFLFIYGTPSKDRDLTDRELIDIDPPYHAAYQELWERCQNRRKLDFTNEAFAFAQHDSTIWQLAGQYEDQDSMFSRLRHNLLRCALILAVNNDVDEADQSLMELVLENVAPYLVACIEATRSATQRTEVDVAADSIVKFILRRYNDHQVWPSKRNLQFDRLWKQLNSITRQAAYDSLVRDGRLICVKVIDDQKKIKDTALICSEQAGWEHWHGTVEQNAQVTEKALYGKVSN